MELPFTVQNPELQEYLYDFGSLLNHAEKYNWDPFANEALESIMLGLLNKRDKGDFIELYEQERIEMMPFLVETINDLSKRYIDSKLFNLVDNNKQAEKELFEEIKLRYNKKKDLLKELGKKYSSDSLVNELKYYYPSKEELSENIDKFYCKRPKLREVYNFGASELSDLASKELRVKEFSSDMVKYLIRILRPSDDDHKKESGRNDKFGARFIFESKEAKTWLRKLSWDAFNPEILDHIIHKHYLNFLKNTYDVIINNPNYEADKSLNELGYKINSKINLILENTNGFKKSKKQKGELNGKNIKSKDKKKQKNKKSKLDIISDISNFINNNRFFFRNYSYDDLKINLEIIRGYKNLKSGFQKEYVRKYEQLNEEDLFKKNHEISNDRRLLKIPYRPIVVEFINENMSSLEKYKKLSSLEREVTVRSQALIRKNEVGFLEKIDLDYFMFNSDQSIETFIKEKFNYNDLKDLSSEKGSLKEEDIKYISNKNVAIFRVGNILCYVSSDNSKHNLTDLISNKNNGIADIMRKKYNVNENIKKKRELYENVQKQKGKKPLKKEYDWDRDVYSKQLDLFKNVVIRNAIDLGQNINIDPNYVILRNTWFLNFSEKIPGLTESDNQKILNKAYSNNYCENPKKDKKNPKKFSEYRAIHNRYCFSSQTSLSVEIEELTAYRSYIADHGDAVHKDYKAKKLQNVNPNYLEYKSAFLSDDKDAFLSFYKKFHNERIQHYFGKYNSIKDKGDSDSKIKYLEKIIDSYVILNQALITHKVNLIEKRSFKVYKKVFNKLKFDLQEN